MKRHLEQKMHSLIKLRTHSGRLIHLFGRGDVVECIMQSKEDRPKSLRPSPSSGWGTFAVATQVFGATALSPS
jgi:hypothetical protein